MFNKLPTYLHGCRFTIARRSDKDDIQVWVNDIRTLWDITLLSQRGTDNRDRAPGDEIRRWFFALGVCQEIVKEIGH